MKIVAPSRLGYVPAALALALVLLGGCRCASSVARRARGVVHRAVNGSKQTEGPSLETLRAARDAPSASAGSASSVDANGKYALPADRRTLWKPGVTLNGGIPPRPTACATLEAAKFGNGTKDATEGIQSAIDACAAGQAVLLGAGTFLVNDDIVYVRKSVTLRGAGAGKTFLRRTNGATDQKDAPGVAKPVIVVGAQRWTQETKSENLVADGAKGATSVTVASAAGIAAGMLVLVDELSGARWIDDPQGHGRKVWASPDLRVVFQMHLPWLQYIDDAGGADATGPFDADNGVVKRPPESMSWFSRTDRPTTEVHEVASVSGNSVTLTSPLHIDYRVSHQAQVTYYDSPTVRDAGLEGMTVTGGDDGDIRFQNAANSWAKNVEVALWRGEGIAIANSHGIEVRDSYVHDAAFSTPGGAAYAISIQGGSADCLLENSIVVRANKVIVARSSGAGCVVAYNYMDQGFINYTPGWQEMGVGGSHMVGPHHMLFEGNWSFNGDNDHTHGSSIFHTYFRNQLTGYRSKFKTNTGIAIDDLEDVPGPHNGPKRAAGASAFSYWMSFVGNVLGTPGHVDGWKYEAATANSVIWAIGWENHGDLLDPDPSVDATLLRDGNFDFLSNAQKWHGIGNAGGAPRPLPDSMYLTSKPAFFGDKPWPWVEPTSGKVHTLPAKARFDAGSPNAVN